jgi:hypothetical protein
MLMHTYLNISHGRAMTLTRFISLIVDGAATLRIISDSRGAFSVPLVTSAYQRQPGLPLGRYKSC